MGVVVRDVKKFAAGRLLWNARTGADLKADFEATAKAEVSFNGCRIANAMLIELSRSLMEMSGGWQRYLCKAAR
jgi:hypothetical protein